MTTEDSPVKQDTHWFPVLITEFLVILIINAITIAAFARIRHLRKRSTYLIINLTVADLLLGAVAGPLYVYHPRKGKNDFSWPGFLSWTFKLTFLIASPVNFSLISLERLHATLFPFRHCLIRKKFYFKIIAGSWFITFLLAFAMAILSEEAFQYAWASFSTVTLLVLMVSYIIIFSNVQSNPHSQDHGSIHTERRLSVTLFLVTVVSLLTIFPWAIYKSMPEDIQDKWNKASSGGIHEMLAVVYFANSMVNPLVYAIRMQEFRKAFENLVSRQRQAAQNRQRRAKQERAHRSQPETNL